ncbi:MAG: BatA domain-containing protein [Planctomycetota bacterium]
MIWANALILGLGGALLTIPVILHLIMQPKPKEVMFPALRFVKKRQSSNRSSVRLRHFLLLLLRILVIALIALALAGPSVASQEFGNWITLGGIGLLALIVGVLLLASLFVARQRNTILIGALSVLLVGLLAYGGISAARVMNSDSSALIGDSQAPVAALVVIDTSPTMDYRFDNKTRLEEAKEMASWLIGQFPSDSQVCVKATDGDKAFFSVDVGAAAKRAGTLELSYVPSGIPEALADGMKLLEDSELERKEIYVISDLTVGNWSVDQAAEIGRIMERNPDINVFVVDVGVEDPVNFSIGEAVLSSSLLTPGSGMTLSTSINRIGPAERRTVRMRIEQPDPQRPVIRDGEILTPDKFWERSQTVDVRENGSSDIDFSFTEQLPVGYYHGVIELEGNDALDSDNQRHFTVHVTEPWKTLVVYGSEVDAAGFVKIIAPEQETTLAQSMFDCSVQSQNGMTSEFSPYRLVVMLNPGPLSNATWLALEKYVETGGALLVFAGHNAADGDTADDSFQSEVATRVLGGALTSQWNRDTTNPVIFSPLSLAHPVFAPFRDRETGVPWDAHSIYKHWGFEFDDRGDELPTSTLLNFSDGQPALIERQIGLGRVMLMTTPVPEPLNPLSGRKSWGNLFSPLRPHWPLYVLVYLMPRYLVNNDAETLNIRVGQLATLKNDRDEDPRQYRMYAPDTRDRAETVTADGSRVRYRFTGTPGQYRLKEGLVVRGFSANIDPDATVLDRLVPEQLDTLLGAGRYQVAREQNEIQRQQGTTRRGQEFYPLLVLMMVLILGVEHLMSNRFYQSP